MCRLLSFCFRAGRGYADTTSESEKIEEYDTLSELGAEFSLGADYLEKLMERIDSAAAPDIIFKTPGIRPDIPPLLKALERGIEITSEMELFLQLCPAPIIGITGSDGKTTTTSIVFEMLVAAGKSAFLGGNIGTPLIGQVESIKSDHIVALEMSSFQLYGMEQSPDFGVITNITPNHLDWHTNMNEYIDAKKKICGLNSLHTKTVVLNADNHITREIAEDVKGRKPLILFSKSLLADGICIEENCIVRRENGRTVERILEVAEIKLPGVHNVENFMAAIAAMLAAFGQASSECALQVANEFGGVAHRIEFLRELNGVKYYNDSIATTPARAKAGLSSFAQKVVVIAGGYDKNLPFDELGEILNMRSKAVVLMGATADKIENAIKSAPNYNGEVNIIRAAALDDAAVSAQAFATRGDVVILSPACASFDMFANFEERGNRFKEIVMGLK